MIIWVFLKQKKRFKTLNLYNNPKVMKFHKKLSRKRWQAINFLTPLFSKVIKIKTFWNSTFQQIFTFDIWN